MAEWLQKPQKLRENDADINNSAKSEPDLTQETDTDIDIEPIETENNPTDVDNTPSDADTTSSSATSLNKKKQSRRSSTKSRSVNTAPASDQDDTQSGNKAMETPSSNARDTPSNNEGTSGENMSGRVVSSRKAQCEKSTTSKKKAVSDTGKEKERNEYDNEKRLLVAVEDGNETEALSLINEGVNVNFFRDGVTPLMIAAGKGLLKTVKALLGKGANVNERSEHPSFSPLMYASMNNHVDIIRCLLEAGAAVNDENRFSVTALSMTTEPEAVDLMVKFGADVNHKDAAGETPLLVACQDLAMIDNVKFLLALIKGGADVCILDKAQTVSPLYMAMNHYQFYDDTEFMLSLLGAGAPKMLPPYKCPIPLAFFIANDYVDYVKAWVVNGGSPVDVCFDCLDYHDICSPVSAYCISACLTPAASPLLMALILGKISIARYFVSMWFLTWHDITRLKTTIVGLRTHQPWLVHNKLIPNSSFEYVKKEFLTQRPSLKLLSFVKVLSHLKWGMDREAMARGTGLSVFLQDMLLFRRYSGVIMEKGEGRSSAFLEDI